MNRYYKLIELVRDRKPEHIVEVGTWNGKRACEMMAVCNAYYTGFDLFEQGTKELDDKEMNVKDHEDMVDVARRIETAGFSKFSLIRGNTRETLPKWIESDDFRPFDFAFIDGGHSEETIRSDYEYVSKAISPGGLIVLDDYYNPPVKGFGCNFIEGEVHKFSDGFRDAAGNTGTVSLLLVEV